MSTKQSDWLVLSLVIATVVLISVSGMLAWQMAWLSVHVAFAEEQTEIFDAMRVKAIAAPDPKTAADCLGYVVNYYPSGSKQDVGSRLDKVVERQRASAIRDIILDLRQKTGEDLGDDPQIWIQKYG